MRRVGSLFGDLGLLALAVVIGWALWYTVREELNEIARRQVEVVVECSGSIDAEPRAQNVSLDVLGPRRAVDTFRSLLAPRLLRRVSEEDLPQDRTEVRRDYTREDLEWAGALHAAGLRVVEMDPPVVSFRLFRVAVQEKAVAPPEFQGAKDLNLRPALLDYSHTALVRGAVGTLSGFREIRTFVPREQLQVFASGSREAVRTVVTMRLEVDPAQKDLFTLVERDALWAKVELSQIAEAEVLVPIAVYQGQEAAGERPRRLQFAEINEPHFVPGDPPRVRLTLTGAPSALATAAGARLRAFVLEGDLPGSQTFGSVPVHVADLPPGVALQKDYSVSVEESR